MRKVSLILGLIILSVSINSKVNADGGDLLGMKKLFEDMMKAPQLQLQFIQQFIKGVILGEIRLYDLSLNQSTKLGAEQTQKIQSEVNDFVSIISQGNYKTLQELINHIKKNDPNALGKLFSEESFKDDIQQLNYQEKLADQILNYLTPSKDDQKLKESFENLDLLKKFLVDQKGMKEEDVAKSIEYMKDTNQIKNSIDFLIKKLGDEKSLNLLKLAMKYKSMKEGNSNPLSMIQDDSDLMELLADKNWGELFKLKDQMTSIGGKTYEEFYKNSGINNGDSNDEDEDEDGEDEDDEDDEDDEERGKKSSTGQRVIFAIFGIVIVAGIGYLILRKCRQNKYNDGTKTENKKLYRAAI